MLDYQLFLAMRYKRTTMPDINSMHFSMSHRYQQKSKPRALIVWLTQPSPSWQLNVKAHGVSQSASLKESWSSINSIHDETWSLLCCMHFACQQSGCCKPPTQCGYTFVNPTYWISPISITSDMDCVLWSNDQMQLCYSCSSCKAGLLSNLRKEWRRANLILVVALVALICVYLMGCHAFRHAKTDELFRRYKQGYTW